MDEIHIGGGIRHATRDYYERCTLNLSCTPCARCEQRLVRAPREVCRACRQAAHEAQVRRRLFVLALCWLAMLPVVSGAVGLVTRAGPDTAVLTLLLAAVCGAALEMQLFRWHFAWRQRREAE